MVTLASIVSALRLAWSVFTGARARQERRIVADYERALGTRPPNTSIPFRPEHAAAVRRAVAEGRLAWAPNGREVMLPQYAGRFRAAFGRAPF